MNDVAIAAGIAGSLLCIAGTIAVIPVKLLQSWLARKLPSLETPLVLIDEASHRDARQEIVSTLMKTYLHDKMARDYLQLAAATKNLHPIGPEDVLTQLIFIRRDLNRIVRDQSHPKFSYGIAALGVHRSAYFHSITEAIIPRTEISTIKYFQQNYDISSDGASEAATAFQRTLLKRNAGTIQ